MHEMKAGKLKSGKSGKTVTSRKQAIAIGLSEARKEGKKVPARKISKKKASKKKKNTGEFNFYSFWSLPSSVRFGSAKVRRQMMVLSACRQIF